MCCSNGSTRRFTGRGMGTHQAPVVGADVEPADIVGHDQQYVRFLSRHQLLLVRLSRYRPRRGSGWMTGLHPYNRRRGVQAPTHKAG